MGTTGYDYAMMTLPGDVEAQCCQTLVDPAMALEAAGSKMAHVVRIIYMLPDRADFPPGWPLLWAAWGAAAPMIECRLMERVRDMN